MADWKILQEWQTLIAGLIALIVGFVTVCTINRQVRQAEKFEKDRILRRRAGVYAALPLTLSELLDYNRQLTQVLKKLFYDAEVTPIPRSGIEYSFPLSPIEVMDRLSDAIEASDDVEVREKISCLLNLVAIQTNRIRNIKSRPEAGPQPRSIFLEDISTYIWDAVEIYVRSDLLFEYVSNNSETTIRDFTSEDLSNGLLRIGLRDPILTRLGQNIPNRGQPNS